MCDLQVMVLCFAVFMGSWSPFTSSVSSFGDGDNAYMSLNSQIADNAYSIASQGKKTIPDILKRCLSASIKISVKLYVWLVDRNSQSGMVLAINFNNVFCIF